MAAQGIENVHRRGTEGVPTAAPYDAILVSAAFPDVPERLVASSQLADVWCSRSVWAALSGVTAFERSAEGLVSRELVCHARFVRRTTAWPAPPVSM